MIKRIVYGLAVLLIATAIWFIFGLFFPIRSLVWLFVIAAVLWLVGPHITRWVQRSRPTTWVNIGVLAFIGLIPPTAIIVEPAPMNNLLPAEYTFGLYLLLPAAIIAAGMLLYAGLSSWAQKQRFDRTTLLCLLLFGLLVVKITNNVYWLKVWDNTSDSMGILWLIIPIFSALLIGSFLTTILPGKSRWGAAYGLLIIVLMLGAYGLADLVGYRQRTEARAEQVRLAVEQYYAREGRYPHNLGELIPRDALWLSPPVIIFGQNWCYNASQDAYRLAYLDREHWSSPNRFAHVAASKGVIDSFPPACGEALAQIDDE
jgi:hypothetical protein